MNGFRSNLGFVGLSPGSRQIASGGAGDFVLDVRNIGNEYWPTVRELGGPAGAVEIALRWYRRDKPAAFVGDNRWPMSVSLLPGDRTRVRVPLVPIGLDGRPLPPGQYEVDVAMVRETVALFSDNGDAVLRSRLSLRHDRFESEGPGRRRRRSHGDDDAVHGARYYDQQLHRKHWFHNNTAKRELRWREVLQMLDLTKDDGVLEIGCAAGAQTVRLAGLCREVVGIDLSAAAIERAIAHAAAAHVSNARVLSPGRVEPDSISRRFVR